MRSGGKGTGGTGGTGDTVGGEGGGGGTDSNGSSSLKSVQISASSPQRRGGGGGGGGHSPSSPVLGSDSHNSSFGQTHNSTTTCYSAPASPIGPCIYLPLSLFRPPSGWTGGGRQEKSFGQGVGTRERAHGEMTNLERRALKNAPRSTHTHTHTHTHVIWEGTLS